MAIKKWCQLGFLSISLIFTTYAYALPIVLPGETLQINTHLRSITGKPTWVLVLRDIESQKVLPYMFDIKNNDNYWIAFSLSHTYQVVSSNLRFDAHNEINNFCGLEDTHINGVSMLINLTGRLTPDAGTSHCNTIKFKSYPLPIAEN
jgi:hypothetical protein